MSDGAENLSSLIAFKLDQVAEKQEKTDEKVSNLTERVLNPESGVFARVKENDVQNQRNREDIEELHDSIDKLLLVCESHDKNINTIEGWVEDHERRDNDLRDSVKKLVDSVTKKFIDIDDKLNKKLDPLEKDFTVRSANKVWKDKIVWLIISALVLGIAVPPIVKLFTGEYQQKPAIEKKETVPKRAKIR